MLAVRGRDPIQPSTAQTDGFMTNILRAASLAAVMITAAGTFVATDPGFATEATAQAALPTLQIDRAMVDHSADAIDTSLRAPDSSLPTQISDETADAPSAIEDAIADADSTKVEAASLGELVLKMPIPDTLDAETQCLAGTIYFESKGETLSGQLAVGRVVLNRVASPRFPNSICGVVYQRSQFSFVRSGKMPRINTASNAWRNAVAIAQIARDELWKNNAKGALFFHAARVSPGWRLTRVAQIDNHIFYR